MTHGYETIPNRIRLVTVRKIRKSIDIHTFNTKVKVKLYTPLTLSYTWGVLHRPSI